MLHLLPGFLSYLYLPFHYLQLNVFPKSSSGGCLCGVVYFAINTDKTTTTTKNTVYIFLHLTTMHICTCLVVVVVVRGGG